MTSNKLIFNRENRLCPLVSIMRVYIPAPVPKIRIVSEALDKKEPQPPPNATSKKSTITDTDTEKVSSSCTSDIRDQSEEFADEEIQLRLWKKADALRLRQTLAGTVPPPPRTPLVIRDLCAISPRDTVMVPNSRSPVAFVNEVCALFYTIGWVDRSYLR